MNRTAAALTAALAVTALAACGTPAKAVKTEPAKATTNIATEGAPVNVTPTPSRTNDGLHTFDETAAYDFGVKISLDDFERRTSEGTPYVRFNITVANTSDELLNLNMLQINCMHAAPGKPTHSGTTIIDYDEGLEGTPTTHALPGKSATIPTGCAFPTTSTELQVEVAPDLDSDPSIFTGTVKK